MINGELGDSSRMVEIRREQANGLALVLVLNIFAVLKAVFPRSPLDREFPYVAPTPRLAHGPVDIPEIAWIDPVDLRVFLRSRRFYLFRFWFFLFRFFTHISLFSFFLSFAVKLKEISYRNAPRQPLKSLVNRS
jgi:hypothetical protein